MVQFTSFSSYITKEQGSITEVAEDDLATSTIQGVTCGKYLEIFKDN